MSLSAWSWWSSASLWRVSVWVCEVQVEVVAVVSKHITIASDWIHLQNVHEETACSERKACVVHNPSAHHMRFWRLLWRDDLGLFERICPHGVGHPDPDQFEFWAETGRSGDGVHGCDGCCREVDE